MSDQPYALIYSDEAIRDLRKLDKAMAERIARKLNRLADEAGDLDNEALTGEFKGLFKYRVGDYRAIYELDHNVRSIIIMAIGHRRDIYDR